MGNIVKRRLPLLLGRTTVPGVSGGGAVLLFTAFYVLSLFMFGMADHALAGRDYLGYWLWKLLFVCAATTTGILISAVLEEWAVAKLAKRKVGDLSFYPSVLRANYITLGVVLLVATLQILPKRLHSPHFLASLFHSFFAACGLS